MFYLLFICSCFIVRSDIHFSESLCFIGTSQFITSVHDLTRYKLAFDVIYYLIAIRFSIIDVSGYQEGFHLFIFDAG